MSEIHYVDTHAHIMSEEFHEDFDQMIQRTAEKNVDRIMIITLSEKETLQAIDFAKQNPNKYQVACGIFPEDVTKLKEGDWEKFVEIASREEITAIGEIGLEYHWVTDLAEREIQKEYFIKQIELAKQLNKPILVHSRDAMQDTYDIMKEHQTRGLLHCFSGTKEMAKEFTKLGYYIALGGALTFKNSRHAKEVASLIDAKYLLTETDCPYMAPVPVRGTRNEPSNIPYITQVMAECRGISVEEMAQIVDDNYTRFLEGK